jgi:hypothetical protein
MWPLAVVGGILAGQAVFLAGYATYQFCRSARHRNDNATL